MVGGSFFLDHPVFTNQPFAFVNAGVLPSLDSHSNHQIIHGKINLHVPCPPPYKRKIWEYNKTAVNKICSELSLINWNNLFSKLNVDQMSNRNVPNKTISCNEKDAPWITEKVKIAIKRNCRVYRKWIIRGRNPSEREHVREVQNATNKLIKHAPFRQVMGYTYLYIFRDLVEKVDRGDNGDGGDGPRGPHGPLGPPFRHFLFVRQRVWIYTIPLV